MPELLDYRKDKLCINGLKVERLTMTGLLAERVPGIARQKQVGSSGVSETHLPGFLDVSLDGLRGRKKVRSVRCDPADNKLAVEVAKAVRTRLCGGRLGLDLVDAMVPVRDGQDRKLGEHDMLLESVMPASLTGLLSTELKLRRLWGTERDREKVRALLRKENCDDDDHWWHEVKSGFAGRLIVVAVFTEKDPESNSFELRADLKLNSEGQWRGLFGWPHAGEERIVLPARPKAAAKAVPAPRAVSKAAPKAAAKAAPKAVAKAVARPAGDAILNRLVWRNGVVELKTLLARVGKDGANATYWAREAKRKHGWSERSLYQEGRKATASVRGGKRRKLGGSGAWFATEAVCVKMLKDWGRYE